MTTLTTIELCCPNCGNQFSAETVLCAGSATETRTDFQKRTAGVQPLPFLVHSCERCGFAAEEYKFSSEYDVSFEVRCRVWDELTPRLSAGAPTASEKYEFAAKVAAWDNTAPRRIADLWLRAAWCSVDEGDIEAERYYRRHAAWNFEEALGSYDLVPPGDRAVLTYLVGELWRRIGDTRRSNQWFDQVREEITDPSRQAWVLRWADRQRKAPLEKFV